MSTFLNTIKQVITPESSLKIPIVDVNVDKNNENNENNENLYDKLDEKYKKAVDKITNEKHKKQAIKIFIGDNKNKQILYDNINNPKLETIYNKLNNKSKLYIDSISITDKYLFLNEKLRKANIEPIVKNTQLSVIHPDNLEDITDKQKPEGQNTTILKDESQTKGLSSKEIPQELFEEEEEKEEDMKDSTKENTKDIAREIKNSQELFNKLIYQ